LFGAIWQININRTCGFVTYLRDSILSPILLHLVYDFHAIKRTLYDRLSQRQLNFLILVFLNEIIRALIVREIV